MRAISSLLLIFILCTSVYSYAGEYSARVSDCMAENTTGKDRKNLARWMFTAVAVHPELKNILVVSPESRDIASREAAAIFTKLLAENCSSEVKIAIKKEGSSGMEAAGKTLGELAMKELMLNQDVAASVADFAKFIDNKKIEEALKSE